MNIVNILALDCDGVLNSEEFCKGLTRKLDESPGQVLIAQHISDVTDQFDPACVQQLARIIRETGCKIVLSSAWRLSGIKVGSPFRLAIIKSVDKDTSDLILRALIGKTPDLNYLGKTREDEILEWVSEYEEKNGCKVNLVAVDDWNLNLDGRSVRTFDENGGLTEEKADEVIRKFNDG